MSPSFFFGETSTWFWTALQAVAVSVTLVLIYHQIRQQSRSNIVQTLSLLSDKWNKRGLLVARARVCRAWKSEKKGDEIFDGDACEIACYFEELGTYVEEGLVGKKICWDIFSYQIEGYYAIFEEGIKIRRRDLKDPNAFQKFEHLRRAMNRISTSSGSPFSEMNNSQFIDFFNCELKSAEAMLNDYKAAS